MKLVSVFVALTLVVSTNALGLWPCVGPVPALPDQCNSRNAVDFCDTDNCVCEDGWDAATNCMTFKCDDCGAGSCIGPNECSCPAGTYGANCESTCNCGLGACDDGPSGTGACSCPANVYGTNCEFNCPVGCGGACDASGACDGNCAAGYYGAACTNECSCDQKCDSVTGNCECFLGRWDAANGCERLCGAGCVDGECDSDDGSCTCLSGFGASTKCQYNCPNTLPGVGNGDEIPCSGNGMCNIAAGTCECDAGYFGPGCASTCPGGPGELACGGERRGVCDDGVDGTGACQCIFGFNPATNCQTCTEDTACGGNGVCNSGNCECAEGYWGPSCAALCPGFDGSNTDTTCFGRGSCDSVSGECDCIPGASGDACQDFSCDPACEEGSTCVPGQQCVCASGATVAAGESCDGAGDDGSSSAAGLVIGIAVPLLLIGGAAAFFLVGKAGRDSAAAKSAPVEAPEPPRAPKKRGKTPEKKQEEKKPLVGEAASPPATPSTPAPPADAAAAAAAPAAAAAAAPAEAEPKKRRSSSGKRRKSSSSKKAPAAADAPAAPAAPVDAAAAAADPELNSAVDENAALRAELERLRAEAAALDE